MHYSIYNFLAVTFYRKQYNQLNDRLSSELFKYKKNCYCNLDLLEKLLISAEDHRFRFHFGFDIYAICRAIYNNLFLKKREGASTIEQQLVRVITNCYEKTYSRKIQEIILSISLYSIVPKRLIPSLYLQLVYFGNNIFGIETYLKVYSIDPLNLSLEQGAEIISKIKYPDPLNHNNTRILKIEKRKQYLINLYNSHSKRIFFKIYE
jgi:membrane peptidoglycan carboxypeptidase